MKFEEVDCVSVSFTMTVLDDECLLEDTVPDLQVLAKNGNSWTCSGNDVTLQELAKLEKRGLCADIQAIC